MNDLVPVEVARLGVLESTIERCLETFVDAGLALQEIRDGHLYRQTHSTFADYCRDRWGFSDSRARQLIRAAVAVTSGNASGAQTEREARRMLERPVEPVSELALYGQLGAAQISWQEAGDEVRRALDDLEKAHQLPNELLRWATAARAWGRIVEALARQQLWAERAAGVALQLEEMGA